MATAWATSPGPIAPSGEAPSLTAGPLPTARPDCGPLQRPLLGLSAISNSAAFASTVPCGLDSLWAGLAGGVVPTLQKGKPWPWVCSAQD